MNNNTKPETDLSDKIDKISTIAESIYPYNNRIRVFVESVCNIFGKHDSCRICGESLWMHDMENHEFVPAIEIDFSIIDDLPFYSTNARGKTLKYRLAIYEYELSIAKYVEGELQDYIPMSVCGKSIILALIESNRLPAFLDIVTERMERRLKSLQKALDP